MPKHETLPADYHRAVIELEGRYYPVRAEREKETGLPRLETCPHLYWEVEYACGIPYALGPQPTKGIISFPSYRRAIDFCHRAHEGFQLLWDWNEQAAGAELYPERSAWYRDAFKQLCGKLPTLIVVAEKAHASVFLRNGTHCSVWAATVDEAWEQLYTQVEAVSQKQQGAVSA